MWLRSAALGVVLSATCTLAACSDQGTSRKTTAQPEATAAFGEPAGANSDLNPCSVSTTTSALRPLNHVGHGDGEVAIPPGYASRTNPCQKTLEFVALGKKVFADNCARCHGSIGDPKDAIQQGLNPPAKRLTVGGFTESYVFWRVEEGGAFEPFNSQMPSFIQKLSETEAWAVTTHVLGLTNADATPLAPAIQSVAPVDGVLTVSWRLNSACGTLEIERKKDTGAFAVVDTVAGFLTEYDDSAATAGQYCYRVTCVAGANRSTPSNESCGAM